MQRRIAIFFLLLFVPVTFGFSLHIHYCGKKVHSVSLTEEVNENGCCPVEKKNDCCSDITKKLEVKKEIIGSQSKLIKVLMSTGLENIPVDYFSFKPGNGIIDISSVKTFTKPYKGSPPYKYYDYYCTYLI